MSIMNDRWIKNQSTGPKFHYYYEGELIHEYLDIEWFKFEDVKEPLRLLEVGDVFQPDDGTTIVLATKGDMISPFVGESVKEILKDGKLVKAPSHGLSSYGYDIRLGRNFKVMNGYRSAKNAVIDPTEPEHMEGFFTDINDVDALELAPHSFALGVSMERITMPNNVTAVCMAKSTLARIGATFQVTPIECAWSGYVTLEIKNETDHPIRLHAGMGVMQLIFHEGLAPSTTYADRGGKYQNQEALPVVAR